MQRLPRRDSTLFGYTDGIALQRPLHLPKELAKKSRVPAPALLAAKQDDPFPPKDHDRAGGPLAFEGYLYWNSKITPKGHSRGTRKNPRSQWHTFRPDVPELSSFGANQTTANHSGNLRQARPRHRNQTSTGSHLTTATPFPLCPAMASQGATSPRKPAQGPCPRRPRT